MANNASPRRTRFQENTGGGPKCRSLSYHPADTETSMAIPGKHSGWSSYRNPELFTRIALSPRGQKFTYMVIFRGYTFVHGKDTAMRTKIGLLAALGMALTLASTLVSTAPAAQRNDKKMQENLSKEVRHQLLLLPYYSVFDNLMFKVDGDKVTLLGQVVRPTLKSDAEASVKGIEAVASVDNQ